MWKHEILEAWDAIGKFKKVSPLRHKTIRDRIISSVSFFFDSASIKQLKEKSAGQKLFCEENSCDFMYPFDSLLLQYVHKDVDGYTDSSEEYSAPKRFVLTWKEDGVPYIVIGHCLPNGSDYLGIKWIFSVFLYKVVVGSGLAHYVPLYDNNPEGMMDVRAKGLESRIVYEDSSEMHFLNIALILFECKNISFQSVLPNEKLNKSRIKKKKTPMFEYKVLNVVLPKRSPSESIETGMGLPQRVHLCRGHFKEYTKDKPLFGRLVGRYWWQPTVRGKGEGVIEKEYHVKVSPGAEIRQ